MKWTVFTSWTNGTGRPITSFKTTWIVPPPPLSQSGQTIFLFNGILNSSMILQPVLQWGASEAGGAATGRWRAGMLTGQGGLAFFTPLAHGRCWGHPDGYHDSHQAVGNQLSYTCKFLSIPLSNLPIENVPELTWCAETLEAYVTKCSDYPRTAKTSFTGIEILTGGQQTQINGHCNLDHGL